MYKFALFLLGFFIAVLIGCQSPYSTTTGSTSTPPPQRPVTSWFRSSVEIKDSQFEKNAEFLGIEAHYPGNRYNHYFLRSYMIKTSGEVIHQLYVSDNYDGSWVF
jgi:hypothetical protein